MSNGSRRNRCEGEESLRKKQMKSFCIGWGREPILQRKNDFLLSFFLFSPSPSLSPSSFQTRAMPCRTTTMTNRCLWIVLTWLFRDVNEENIISEQNQHALSLPLVYLLFTCSHMFSKSTSAGHQLTPKSSAALYRIDLQLVPSAWPTGIRQTRSPIMQSRAEKAR